jgi:ADP-heptose:LPS heptosyltransferase
LKILAINFGGIGDEILFLPTLESIREAYPQASLSLLLEPRSKSFQQVTNLVDNVLEFDIKKKPLLPGDLWAVLQLIKKGNFDLVISSGSSPPVAALLFLSGIPTRVGYGSNALAKLLLTNPVPLDRNQYAACMYQDLAQGIGVAKMSAEQCIPRAVLRDDSKDRMQQFIQTIVFSTAYDGTNGASAKRRVLIHPGTSRLAVEKGIIKTWPTDRWLALIERLQSHDDIQTIIAGGPDDEATIKELLARIKPSPTLVSAYGKTKSLADLAALISLCDLMVCVDSAPMHLAVGLNKPVVALFGPTDEAKLLPNETTAPVFKKFKALRDKPMTEFSRQLLDGLGVLLQPDNVYRSVLDQLRESKVRENSPGPL